MRFDAARQAVTLARPGGDWGLVASLVFKTMGAPNRRAVGSIPIHLRQCP